MQVHIINSVKGGSGKSTFAVKLGCSLIDAGKTPCVVDLDLLGTSWFHLYANALVGATRGNVLNMIFLNDLVNDYECFKNTNFIQKIKFAEATPSNKYKLSVIFANPSETAKKQYRINGKADHTNVSFEFFKNIVMNLINVLDEMKYTDVVLDMPPNSDPYADKILYACLDTEFSFQTSLYTVSSLNAAHIKSTFDWCNDLYINPDSRKIVCHNDFVNLSGVTYASEQFANDPDLKDKKRNWFEKTKNKFFIVLNKTNNNPDNYSVAITRSWNIDMQKQMAYYILDFDDKFSKVTDLFKSEETTEIVFGNKLKHLEFSLYSELSK